MINKTTLGFILILVAAFLSVVEGDGSQEIDCEGPGKVEDLFLTPCSNKIFVNWNKPNISDCVTLYFISWKNLETGSFYNSIVSRDVNFYVIEDLDVEEQYAVTVTSVNERGQSLPVPGYTTTVSDVPGKVEDLLLEPCYNKIHVNWNKPNINVCVTLYYIEWKNLATGSFYSSVVSREVNFYVIEDLNVGGEYEVTVIAVNDLGQSLAVSGNTTTVPNVPGQVEDLLLEPCSHKIFVSWNKPIINNHCVTLYFVSWKNLATGSFNNRIVSREVNFLVIEDLNVRVQYEVTVRAVNDLGQSPALPGYTTTVSDGPGNIANLTAEPESHSINISWINTNEDENCNVSYVIAWKGITNGSTNGSDVTEINSYVIDSLEACVTFEISVTALSVNCCDSESEIINKTTLPDGTCEVEATTPSHGVSVDWKKPTIIAVVLQIVLYSVCTL